MKTTTLHIKNMVCPRCKLVVENELTALGANVLAVELGRVFTTIPDHVSLNQINDRLLELGLELIEDREEHLVESIKVAVLKYVQWLEDYGKQIPMSKFLVKEVGKNYHYLSKLFSRRETQTIENFCIKQRIQRVKELLQYNELNLSEIAISLGYSSVHYLSSQFRKVTGLSVSDFKKEIALKHNRFSSVENVLRKLRDQGFNCLFLKSGHKIECKSIGKIYDYKELEIKEVYRFNESPNLIGSSAIFTVDTRNGLKGILFEKCWTQQYLIQN